MRFKKLINEARISHRILILVSHMPNLFYKNFVVPAFARLLECHCENYSNIHNKIKYNVRNVYSYLSTYKWEVHNEIETCEHSVIEE